MEVDSVDVSPFRISDTDDEDQQKTDAVESKIEISNNKNWPIKDSEETPNSHVDTPSVSNSSFVTSDASSADGFVLSRCVKDGLNPKNYSEENLLNGNVDRDLVKNENRRSSLPDIFSANFPVDSPSQKGQTYDSISMGGMETSEIINPLRKDEKIVQSDKKNMANVVKNVHGLFSYVGGSIKNAYKPMEKNISGMVIATQRNLASAKNEYLKMDKSAQRASDSIKKYNTLQLNNENSQDTDVFKKCGKFSIENDNEGVLSSENVNIIDYGVAIDDSVSANIVENNLLNSEFSMQQYKPNYDTASIDAVADTIKNIDDQKNIHISVSKEVENLNDNVLEYEHIITQLKTELNILRLAIIDKDAIKKNLESKLNVFMKQLETVTIERDASVVRYATSERNALEAIRSKEAALAAEQAAKREVSMITQRLRTANAEKTRATGSLDMKCHELSLSQKEVSRLKDELQSCDVKLKWAQSKLTSEMDAHRESTSLVEKLSIQLKQTDATGYNAFGMIPPTNETENQLREKEAVIILEKHEKERFEGRCKQLQTEVDQLKNALNFANKEVKELRTQVESDAAEAAALRRTCSELREQGAKDCERLAVAQARAARCDTLATHLQQEQDKSAKLAQELEAMRVLREEALAEGELRMRREAELLRQTERLTAAGVKLQATCSEAEAKALALTVENASLRETANRAAAEAAEARSEAANERDGRAADARALASRAAQHARGEREALGALEALKGDMHVLTTKHASALKELKRELQLAKRKCDKLETDGRHVMEKITYDKTGSTSSLSSYEGQGHNSQSSENPNTEVSPHQTPDKQRLIERIVALQRTAAKRTEKLEFLEEHNRQLMQELQRKTKLLRSYLISAPPGGLTSAASDAVKAEIGRHGGVMASVFGSQVTDETMTLDLSLEINAKLQSLLEDTLLSNITLKENMDTLGDEIARLKENKQVSRTKK